MRLRAFMLAALVPLLIPASAAADYPHVVQKGETLTSVAATDGLSIGALAVANNISTNSELVAGQILEIPPRTPANRASVAQSSAAAQKSSVAQKLAVATAQPVINTEAVTSGSGGAPVHRPRLAVTTISSTGTTPYPTQEHVTGAEIADIATANGVPAALAEAVAWQESGWNNAEVSNVGAVGVMQIVPSTWSWIDSYLTPTDPLGTSSALENVRAGALLLHQLLMLTDDNQSLAIAGYFQGLSSVEKVGMYRSTRSYVANVLALEQRLGA
jgi:soluble lytic murein transglycosylase-like protein